MKISKTTKQNKIILVCSLVLVLIVAAGTLYYFGFHQESSEKDISEAAKKIENDKETEKKLAESSGKGKPTTNDSDHPAEPQPIEGSNKRRINLDVVLGKNISGQALNVSGTIGAFVEDGSCVYHFTHTNGTKIDKTARLLPSASTTVCSSVNLTTGDFSTGSWSVYIDFSNNSYEGKSNDQNFTL